jgi:hypothetical protein
MNSVVVDSQGGAAPGISDRFTSHHVSARGDYRVVKSVRVIEYPSTGVVRSGHIKCDCSPLRRSPRGPRGGCPRTGSGVMRSRA